MPGHLQEGIFHTKGDRPKPFFGMLFLRAGAGFGATEVGNALVTLWEVWRDLKRGTVRDLPGHQVPDGGLTVLLGYGPQTFRLEGVRRALPGHFNTFRSFARPSATGGGTLLQGGGINYADDIKENPAAAHVAVQFIADTALAVNRAIVETWKHLHDTQDNGRKRLEFGGFCTGFQRDDGRSWIDFHDGLSNLKSEDRQAVLEISPDYSPVGEDDEWTYGGTYLAFIKLTVDLSSWRTLLRERQELLVGRDKLSGCPLVSTQPNAAVPGCPATGTHEVGEDAANNVFREPPTLPETEQALNSSHVQRANHHIDPFHDLTAQRIFRQGYEFLEAVDGSPQFRAGLNFVSFQNTPLKLFRVLVQQGWLGRVNFGGLENNQPGAFASLLSARAAGIFLVPPVVDGDSFPGESIFF